MLLAIWADVGLSRELADAVRLVDEIEDRGAVDGQCRSARCRARDLQERAAAERTAARATLF